MTVIINCNKRRSINSRNKRDNDYTRMTLCQHAGLDLHVFSSRGDRRGRKVTPKISY